MNNVFNLTSTTVSFYPEMGGSFTESQIQNLYDGKFGNTTPNTSWGVCTSAATSTSITLHQSNPVSGHTMIVTLSGDQTTMNTANSVSAKKSDGTTV